MQSGGSTCTGSRQWCLAAVVIIVVKNVRVRRILEKYNDCRKNIQRRIRKASGAIVDSTQYGRVISKLIAVIYTQSVRRWQTGWDGVRCMWSTPTGTEPWTLMMMMMNHDDDDGGGWAMDLDDDDDDYDDDGGGWAMDLDDDDDDDEPWWWWWWWLSHGPWWWWWWTMVVVVVVVVFSIIHCVRKKNETKMFFVIFPIKLRWFWWQSTVKRRCNAQKFQDMPHNEIITSCCWKSMKICCSINDGTTTDDELRNEPAAGQLVSSTNFQVFDSWIQWRDK